MHFYMISHELIPKSAFCIHKVSNNEISKHSWSNKASQFPISQIPTYILTAQKIETTIVIIFVLFLKTQNQMYWLMLLGLVETIIYFGYQNCIQE